MSDTTTPPPGNYVPVITDIELRDKAIRQQIKRSLK